MQEAPVRFLGWEDPPEKGQATHSYSWASLVAQMVKHLSAMQEIWVQPLGWEDPPEKKMAAHSSTLAWKNPWMEDPSRLQSTGSQKVGHD